MHIFSGQMIGWKLAIFPDNQKVRRFCLTLVGEARLWYETLGTAQLD